MIVVQIQTQSVLDLDTDLFVRERDRMNSLFDSVYGRTLVFIVDDRRNRLASSVACSYTHSTSLRVDDDVDESQRWGEYGSVSEGDSATVDTSGSDRMIVAVHSGAYGEEEVYSGLRNRRICAIGF